MEFKSPNIDTLRQIYRQSPVAKAFFDHAARRERDQSETKVDRILVLLRAEGHEFRRRDIIDLFANFKNRDAANSLKVDVAGLPGLFGAPG